MPTAPQQYRWTPTTIVGVVILASLIVVGLSIGIPYFLQQQGIQIEPEQRVEVLLIGYCKVNTGSFADSDQAVYIYSDNNGAIGSLIESATASSGKCTFTQTYVSGDYVWVFPRQAAPDSADPYCGVSFDASASGAKPEDVTVSQGAMRIQVPDAGEQGDTVSLGSFYVRDAAASAPTMTAQDHAGNAISDNTNNYLNTTDDHMTIIMTGLGSDTWWGSVDFTDPVTGYAYVGGIFVWKGTVAQNFNGYYDRVDAGSSVYYVWKMGGFCDDSNSDTDGTMSYTVYWSGDLVNDATVTLDAYDTQKKINMQNANFGGLINVAQIDTKVA